MVSQTRAGGGSWGWGLDEGPTLSPTQTVSQSGPVAQIAFWEVEAPKTTADFHLGLQLCIYEAKNRERVADCSAGAG